MAHLVDERVDVRSLVGFDILGRARFDGVLGTEVLDVAVGQEAVPGLDDAAAAPVLDVGQELGIRNGDPGRLGRVDECDPVVGLCERLRVRPERRDVLGELVAVFREDVDVGFADGRDSPDGWPLGQLQQCVPIGDDVVERVRQPNRLVAVPRRDRGRPLPVGGCDSPDAATAQRPNDVQRRRRWLETTTIASSEVECAPMPSDSGSEWKVTWKIALGKPTIRGSCDGFENCLVTCYVVQREAHIASRCLIMSVASAMNI
ncbi:hypothetical protein ACFQER_00915 [Halomicroarcula sp. GCM10025894]|uniref:hypothetical protein n=1 Tax=Halomicroarcula sp. GCM10025894 TaxID=3252673 RepID=UPI00360EFDB9